MTNEEVVIQVHDEEYEPKFQFLRRNSLLVKTKALVCELSIDSKVDQIYRTKYK